MHRLRGVHRRLRFDHGQDGLSSRAGQLHQRTSTAKGGKTHLLRPRLIGYSAVLLVMIAALVVALVQRPMVRWM